MSDLVDLVECGGWGAQLVLAWELFGEAIGLQASVMEIRS